MMMMIQGNGRGASASEKNLYGCQREWKKRKESKDNLGENSRLASTTHYMFSDLDPSDSKFPAHPSIWIPVGY